MTSLQMARMKFILKLSRASYFLLYKPTKVIECDRHAVMRYPCGDFRLIYALMVLRISVGGVEQIQCSDAFDVVGIVWHVDGVWSCSNIQLHGDWF